MKKKYANIRVSLAVKSKIDSLVADFGTADNALRGLLGLPLLKDPRSQMMQGIPMQLMIVVVLKMLSQWPSLSRKQMVDEFESRLKSIPDKFNKEHQILASNFLPRWYSKLGNAIAQGRKSGYVEMDPSGPNSNKALWRLTPKGQTHLIESEPLIEKATNNTSSDFILNLLK